MSSVDLEAAEKKISNAWWAALFSAGVTLIFVFISLHGEAIAGIDAWAFLDVGLLLGLAFGVSQKSRTCAVILLVYFIGSKLLMWKEAGNVRGLPVALVFMWFFAQGVAGTFQYHSLMGSVGGSRTALPRASANATYAGKSKSGTPWLAWTFLVALLAFAGGGAWYFKSLRQAEPASAARSPTQQEIQAAAVAAVGRLNRLEMSGATSPLSAAIAVDEGVMLVPCRGISPGAELSVKMASRDILAKLEMADESSGLCKLTLKDVGSWPLPIAPAVPKIGDAVFAASFDPGGKVVVSPGEVKKVSPGAHGTVIESSARAGAPLEGTPLLDSAGRVVAIALDGQDTALPEAWTANRPAR